MAEVQCGQFSVARVSSGLVTWTTTLAPTPDAKWISALKTACDVALRTGSPLGTLEIGRDSLQFSARETDEKAIAGAVRDVIGRINADVRKMAEDEERQRAPQRALRAQDDDLAQRMKDKYPRGL